jgi:predicted N-acetyltransferase YhbS
VASIRVMIAADAAAVARLATQLGYPARAGEVGARLEHLRRYPDDEVLVAVDATNAVIGWIHVSRTTSLQESDLASIGGLVVDDGHRSSGIGADLVRAAEEWARQHGATRMVVRSRSTRERTHRFYKRMGYAELKRSHVFGKRLV